MRTSCISSPYINSNIQSSKCFVREMLLQEFNRIGKFIFCPPVIQIESVNMVKPQSKLSTYFRIWFSLVPKNTYFCHRPVPKIFLTQITAECIVSCYFHKYLNIRSSFILLQELWIVALYSKNCLRHADQLNKFNNRKQMNFYHKFVGAYEFLLFNSFSYQFVPLFHTDSYQINCPKRWERLERRLLWSFSRKYTTLLTFFI